MLVGCLALIGLGLVMIASASTEVAAVQSGSALYYMTRHLIYIVLGLGACIVTMMIPIATWQRLGWLMLLGAFGLLVMVIIPGIGREVNGSMRWIGFSFFNVQPSEIAKVFVVIYLAGYLVRRQKEVRESWMGFFKPFIVLLPMAGLLLMEPDFGATVVMMGAAAAMLFLGGVGLFRFSLMVVLAVGAVVLLIQMQPYRMARLTNFADPWADQFGAGYQLSQALIAFGRGEWLGVGLGACIMTMMVPIATWQRLGWLLLIGAFGLLVMVLIPGIGREVNGSMRWIGFSFFNVQPSEVAKVFVVIYLAGYLVRQQKEVRESWMGFFKPFIVLLPMAGLLLMEPDFGATVVMMGAAAAMLFLGGVGLFRFALMVALAVGAVFVLVQAQPYRMARLITFTDPWSDQFGSGYQLTQALIAFGRGEWFGVGLGNSVQKQFYLPEAHTDFVFSVLAEELGVVGSLLTLALFVFVCVRGMYIGMWAERAKQYFAAYMAYGLSFLWIGQFLINIGVNVGLLPT